MSSKKLMKEIMSYEIIEQYIYDEDINTYDILNALHPFYKHKLYQKVADICRLSDDVDHKEYALNIIKMMGKIKRDIIDSFHIVSLSYDEIRTSDGITSRQADKCRINIRRLLAIKRDDDIVQSSFDDDKKNRYKKIKFNNKSVQDSIDKKISNNRARDWHIANSLDASMQFAGLTQSPIESGWLITLTLPSKYRSLPYERCIEEINHRLNMIKKYSERYGIVWTGTYCIELHKDETPHIHLIYYVNHIDKLFSNGLRREKITDKTKLEDLIFKFFKEEKIRSELDCSINREIYDFNGILGYIFKDYGKPNTRHGFIGLKRDIKSIWNNLYIGNFGHKSLSYLSDNKLFLSRKLMKSEDFQHYTMFSLKCFRDDKLNYLGGEVSLNEYDDMSMFDKMNYNKSHIIMFEDLNRKNPTKIRKTLGLLNVIYVFVYVYLYKYTKNVYRDFNITKSRGQPPPI